MTMNTHPLLLATVLSSIALTGCQTAYVNGSLNNSDLDGVREVNNVYWDKTGNTFEVPDNMELADNQSRIVFYRPQVAESQKGVEFSEHSSNAIAQSDYQESDYQDSVNIGINNKFHTSLQSEQYSEAIVCSGEARVSAEITSNKTNRLDNADLTSSLSPKQTYYYQVNVDAANNTVKLNETEESTAINRLQNLQQQSHQISRVLANNCEARSETAPSIAVNVPIKLDVLFDFDSANIRSGYQPKLQELAEFMAVNHDVKAVLEGHTDSKGPASYNLRLSQARAEAVKTSLVNQYGADSNRINTIGYGETKPVDTNDTIEGRQNNRRVVAIIK